MVDVHARRRLAEAARALVSGRITNDEFEARIPDSPDSAIREVFHGGFWYLYGDLHKHRLVGRHRVNDQAREFAARCIMFLKTDVEYSWSRKSGFGALVTQVLGLLSLGLVPMLLRENESRKFWSFTSEAELKLAVRQPVYLRGGV